jgi:4a-hydroxytetrahydrobiopterin dehydratase
MSALKQQPLQNCNKDCEPLDQDSQHSLLEQLPEWQINQQDGSAILNREYKLSDFAGALALCNAIGALAEEADHHPQICIEWGKLQVKWWTHSINGLFINDFIMAARSDHAFQQLPSNTG